jgi:hypothetical protein
VTGAGSSAKHGPMAPCALWTDESAQRDDFPKKKQLKRRKRENKVKEKENKENENANHRVPSF